MNDRSICICRSIAVASFASLFFMVSCTDETTRFTQSERILFASDIQNSWTSLNTRSTTESADTSVALKTNLGNIYLHTVYTDSICTSSNEKCVTRSNPINEDNMYDTFGVSAYAYTDTWDETQRPNYMHNVPVRKSGNLWMSSSTYYWPGKAYKMRFFAYAPMSENAYRLSDQTSGAPTITCTVPQEVGDQKDLIVAASPEVSGGSNTVMSLTFHHALTAIKFVCGNDIKQGTVKSVTLKNVFSSGVYNMQDAEWSGIENPATFTQELNKSVSGTENEGITTPAQTFMMIPQALPENAEIEVVFNDGTSEHTLTASLAHTSWPMGKTVTYKISTTSINWEYTLTVIPPTTYNIQGGSSNYSITSYKKNSKVEQPVSWTAEFSADGKNWSTTKPDWLTAFSSGTSGAGSVNAVSYTATVASQQGVSRSAHTEALRQRTAKGTQSMPYNLANSSGDATIQNTANCYVINSPGEYYFPLVYGNAIKNEKDNKSAYFYDYDDIYILKNFINHLGNPIRSPRIYEHTGCQPQSCKLLWQDAPGLLSNVSLYDDQHAIRFTVNAASIQQGNALIAVYDANGKIMWSWHIWVTDTDVSQTKRVMSSYGMDSQMMTVNLGWCDGEHVSFASRECQVRITANEKVSTFTITQEGLELDYNGNNPYYQWGRKDPFYPGDIGTLATKYWYDDSGQVSNNNPATYLADEGNACITWGIMNPQILNKNTAMDNKYLNLWDADNNTAYLDDETPTKSIYDPCPAGFKLPRGWEFTGFSITGPTQEEKDIKDMNVAGSFTYGWNFYCGLNKTGETIFFPATGSRYNTDSPGKPNRIGKDIQVYGAAPSGYANGYSFRATEISIWISRPVDRYGAFSIRPIRDDQ